MLILTISFISSPVFKFYGRFSVSFNLQDILYKIRKLEQEKHRREPNVYWITDLIRCPLKREYEFKYPELLIGEIFEPRFLLGELVHLGLRSTLLWAKENKLLEGEIEAEVEGEKELDIGDKKISIKGRIDLILTFNGKRIGYEVKYVRTDTGIPYEHHKLQARLYQWLLNLDEVYLIYITPERVAEYNLNNERISDLDIIAIVREQVIKTKVPRWPWECRYCPFSVMCSYKKV